MAFLRLKEVEGLGDRGIRKLVDARGSGLAALRALGRKGREELRDSGEESLRGWRGRGIQVLPMTAPSYPATLLELPDPPPLLFLRGNASLLTSPSVAVVGSRRASEVGRRAAETVGRVLAEAGVTVVSGMALGIDGAAHRGALKGSGPTVAVLGSGLDVVYPRPHRGLSKQIGKTGLLVSEFLPGESALPHHFPRRNRIIAALARAVIVVEAGKRSGALITVDHALDLGREILAVPGSVESTQSAGSNALLRDGARALATPEGILEQLADLIPGDVFSRSEPKPVDSVPSSLPPGLRPLWAALSPDPVGIDQVAQRASMSPSQALAGLAAMELEGWVRQCPGMRFRRW